MTPSPSDFANARWRLANLYWITDKDGNKILFKPNAAQTRFLDEVHSKNIILKSRQLGFTTLCCLIYLDACLFNPNTRAAIIAHRLDDAKIIFRDKVKFPYDNLLPIIRDRITMVQDSADTLTFNNNSSIRVSVSARSGTLQYLHISEFGKICALYPEKAREIVTGALPAVATDQFVAIESTAEGQEGAFYSMTQRAREAFAAGRPLTELDYKFHFYPWWEDPGYSLDAEYVFISDDDARYFRELEDRHGIKLTEGQKRWWVKTSETQGGDMKREYPATPDEAFEQALEGAYFSHQLFAATKQGRIGGFPYVPRAPVNTFWDLGRNDLNTIWLHQNVDGFDRFIGYYENSGEFIGHYVSWLRDWARERDATFGEHYIPHDGDRESLWLEGGTRSVMQGLNFYPRIVERPRVKGEAINAARAAFARCQFDERSCSIGLKRLREYRKEWDEERGVWRDRPRHDDASHCFTGDTKILTRYGACRIMDLPYEGEVLTRCGWKVYRNPRVTRINAPLVEVVFSDGSTVKCTPDHLFATVNGWKSAQSLRPGSLIQSSLIRSSSISMGEFIGFGLKKTILPAAAEDCIETFGGRHLGKSLKDAIYTIATAMLVTMQLVIWNVFLPISILAINGGRQSRISHLGNTLAIMPGKRLRNGMLPTKVAHGIGEWRSSRKVILNGRENCERALYVAKCLRASFARMLGMGFIVAESAGPLRLDSVTKLTETADVWCLTVPDAGEFSLANGAIVHNCADAFQTFACSGYQPVSDAVTDIVKKRDMSWIV